jgi:hypothetical protein
MAIASVRANTYVILKLLAYSCSMRNFICMFSLHKNEQELRKEGTRRRR